MRTKVVLILAALGIVALGGLLLLGILPRRAVQRQLAGDVDNATHTLPLIAASRAERPTKPTTLLLPGTMEALHEVALYSRVAGYVKSWHADIGARVHKGELLAELTAPELEDNVRQSRALLAQAQSVLMLAKWNYERYRALFADSAVTAQEFEQMREAYDSAAAGAQAAEAALASLTVLRNYLEIHAPFNGVVTARNVDYGSLVSAAGASATPLTAGGSQLAPPISISAASLFQVAQTDTLRVYIDVPQPDARSIQPGQPTVMIVPNFGNRTFEGRVVRAAHAFDLQTRTMLAEIDVPNPERLLAPGMYVQLRITLGQIGAPPRVPSTALGFRSDGPQVFLLTPSDSNVATVHLQNVEVGRDFGGTLEIASGVTEGAIVATMGSQMLSEGQKVRFTLSANQPGGPPSASPAAQSKPKTSR
jgi:membrane fusion protein, multidrug efflux system